jgi:hypothetical protein
MFAPAHVTESPSPKLSHTVSPVHGSEQGDVEPHVPLETINPVMQSELEAPHVEKTSLQLKTVGVQLAGAGSGDGMLAAGVTMARHWPASTVPALVQLIDAQLPHSASMPQPKFCMHVVLRHDALVISTSAQRHAKNWASTHSPKRSVQLS